jgi:hypothetical protein
MSNRLRPVGLRGLVAGLVDISEREVCCRRVAFELESLVVDREDAAHGE